MAVIEEENSFFQACMPSEGHISKIRLLEEIARIKATVRHENTFVFYDGVNMIMLNEATRVMIVRHDNTIVCDTCPMKDGMVFYGGEWFEGIEKYRSEIEDKLKAVHAEHIMDSVRDSFKFLPTQFSRSIRQGIQGVVMPKHKKV